MINLKSHEGIVSGSFGALCAIGICARFSYALARTPVLPLFALYLGAGPEVIGWVVGISTVTGIFFKLPSGALSDWIGRGRTLFLGLLIFALTPFAYLLVWATTALLAVRFIHGFATAIYGPVSMAIVADVAGARKGEMLSWFSSLTIVGTLLGAPVGGYLLRAAGPGQHLGRGDFLTVFLLSGLSGVMALILGLGFARRRGQDGEGPAFQRNLPPALRRHQRGAERQTHRHHFLDGRACTSWRWGPWRPSCPFTPSRWPGSAPSRWACCGGCRW